MKGVSMLDELTYGILSNVVYERILYKFISIIHI